MKNEQSVHDCMIAVVKDPGNVKFVKDGNLAPLVDWIAQKMRLVQAGPATTFEDDDIQLLEKAFNACVREMGERRIPWPKPGSADRKAKPKTRGPAM